MTRRALVVGVSTLVLLAGGGVSFFLLQATPDTAPNINVIRTQFETDINLKGGKEAYKKFLSEPALINEHVAAHLFGESLYSVEGISGVRACGTEFHYGCYHGFFMQAISTEGLPVVAELNQACREASQQPSLECLHGIGHGLSEFMGPQRLTEALATCKEIEPTLSIEGCLSGAFMEHNVPRVVAKDGTLQVDIRPLLATGDPLEPCTSVASEFKAACYHELPRWWKELYPERYDTIGRLCSTIASPLFQHVCFHGLGVVASDTGTAGSQDTIRRCAMIGAEEGKLLCLQEGAYLSSERGDINSARSICAELPDTLQAHCPREVPALFESE